MIYLNKYHDSRCIHEENRYKYYENRDLYDDNQGLYDENRTCNDDTPSCEWWYAITGMMTRHFTHHDSRILYYDSHHMIDDIRNMD